MKKTHIVAITAFLIGATGFVGAHISASDGGWLSEQARYEEAVRREHSHIEATINSMKSRMEAEKELILAKKDNATTAEELTRLVGRLSEIEGSLADISKEGVWLTTDIIKK